MFLFMYTFNIERKIVLDSVHNQWCRLMFLPERFDYDAHWNWKNVFRIWFYFAVVLDFLISEVTSYNICYFPTVPVDMKMISINCISDIL